MLLLCCAAGFAVDNPNEIPYNKIVVPKHNDADLEAVIDAQLKAIRGGDLGRAYYGYTSAEFRKATPFPEFDAFIKKSEALGKNKTIEKVNTIYQDKYATFQGRLTSIKGEKFDVEFDFIQGSDGQWKVLGIQLYKPHSKF